ncbi:MAG: hypothetical protein WA865_16545 [Spirulinaceae cyanobacterium]
MTSPSLPELQFDVLHLSWCADKTNSSPLEVAAGKLVGKTGNTGRSTGPISIFRYVTSIQVRSFHLKKLIWFGL